MVTEDYCSNDLYRLLLEKGFDGEVCTTYDEEGYTQASISLYVAMKWLREAHKLHIEFVLNQDVQDENAVIENDYNFNVSRLDRFANEGGDCRFYNSHKEACEAGIKYCLENLI